MPAAQAETRTPRPRPVAGRRERVVDPPPQLLGAREEREQGPVPTLRFLHRDERRLAALAAVEVRERRLDLRAAQLTVEMAREQRKEPAALLRQARWIDLREPKLRPEVVAGTRDQLGDRVLVQPDDLADLGVAPVLELAQRQHQPLAGREARVRDAHLLLLAMQERAPLRVVVDRRGRGRLGNLGDRLGAPPALEGLQEQVPQGREQVRAELDRLRVEPVEPRQRPHERLLHQVVGVVRVAGEPVRKRAQAGAVLAVKLLPRCPVAFVEPSGEDAVSGRRRRRHRSSVGLPARREKRRRPPAWRGTPRMSRCPPPPSLPATARRRRPPSGVCCVRSYTSNPGTNDSLRRRRAKGGIATATDLGRSSARSSPRVFTELTVWGPPRTPARLRS